MLLYSNYQVFNNVVYTNETHYLYDAPYQQFYNLTNPGTMFIILSFFGSVFSIYLVVIYCIPLARCFLSDHKKKLYELNEYQ